MIIAALFIIAAPKIAQLANKKLEKQVVMYNKWNTIQQYNRDEIVIPTPWINLPNIMVVKKPCQRK